MHWLFVCLKKKQFNLVSIKIDDWFILLIPLYFFCDFINFAHSFLLIITLFALVRFLNNRNSLNLKLDVIKFSVINLIISWPLIVLTSLFSMFLFSEFEEQEIVTKLKTDMNISLLLSSIIIAPVLEEIYFRKIVYRILKKKIGVFIGIVISSCMFGIIHYNLYSFGTLFLISIICTINYENTGRIIHSILIHSFFNLVMIIFTYIR